MRALARPALAALLAALLAAPAASAAGVPAPALVDSYGHPFQLDYDRGRVVALIVVSRYTRRDAERINDALTPVAGERVDVITAVDFMGIPGLFHGFARRKIKEAQSRSRIRMLCDEQGQWRRWFGLAPDRRVDIIVLDRDGNVRGRFAGPSSVDQALRLIHAL